MIIKYFTLVKKSTLLFVRIKTYYIFIPVFIWIVPGEGVEIVWLSYYLEMQCQQFGDLKNYLLGKKTNAFCNNIHRMNIELTLKMLNQIVNSTQILNYN